MVIPTYIISFTTFILQLTLTSLAIEKKEWSFIIGDIVIYLLSITWGIIMQVIGAKYHSSHSYIITGGLGMQVPFLQLLTFYFTWKFQKRR